MIETTILILILAFLTLSSAFWSGSEAALFSLSPMRVKAYRATPDIRKKLISDLLHHPRDLLVTVFMMNTLVNILLQNVMSAMFGTEAGWGLKVGVPLFITLFLGEILPKNYCMQNNISVSHKIVPYVDFFHRWLAGIRKWTIAITHPISKFMFFYLKKEEEISDDELEHVLKTSEEHGVLHPDEAGLVWGYIQLHHTTVKEIMVPREDILFYNTDEPLTKLTHLFVEQQCSRLPVCRKNLDDIAGVISAKEFFINSNEIANSEDLIKFLRKPFYVPETTMAFSLMRQFDETGQVIALVVDEYGSVTGIVTKEDIAELVIGQITDMRDLQSLYTQAGKNEIIASGKLELSEFNKLFGVEFDSPSNMVTIGGWLIEAMGEIPKGGTTFETEAFLFQILAAEPNRIRRVYIRKKVPDHSQKKVNE